MRGAHWLASVQPGAVRGRKLWITPFATPPLGHWPAMRDPKAGLNRKPLPLIGVGASSGPVWERDDTPVSAQPPSADPHPPIRLPPRTRARGVAAGEQGGAGRVAGQADNVGLAATDRCHVAWQSLAASLERFPFRWNRARTIIACPIDQRRGSI